MGAERRGANSARCSAARTGKEGVVTPEQFKAIRKRFFPSDPTAFLMEMGYAGNRATLKARARRFENGKMPIPRNVSRFAWLLEQWAILENRADPNPETIDGLPDWPEGI
jgi:hypothetical protein